VHERLLRRVRRECSLPCKRRVANDLVRTQDRLGRGEVMRELGRVRLGLIAVELFEYFGDVRVEPRPPCQGELVGECPLDQRMGELVAARVPGALRSRAQRALPRAPPEACPPSGRRSAGSAGQARNRVQSPTRFAALVARVGQSPEPPSDCFAHALRNTGAPALWVDAASGARTPSSISSWTTSGRRTGCLRSERGRHERERGRA
jgi:hypothetical protein